MKLPPDKRLLVIIPAYNEQDSLAQVISSVFDAVPEADVVVVNDGSQDDTAKVAAEVGARVINLTYNLGIGAAVQTGFILAAEEGARLTLQRNRDGFTVQVTRAVLKTAKDPSDAPGLWALRSNLGVSDPTVQEG